MKVSSGLATKINWDQFSYMVFDSPNFEDAFSKRFDFMVRNVSPSHPFVKVAEFRVCRDLARIRLYK